MEVGGTYRRFPNRKSLRLTMIALDSPGPRDICEGEMETRSGEPGRTVMSTLALSVLVNVTDCSYACE